MSVRKEQIEAVLAEEEYLKSIDAMDADELEEAYAEGWVAVHAAKRRLEPLHHAKIVRAVREVVPGATAISIEPTDQGGDGWVLCCAVERIVRLADGSHRDDVDGLHDSDELAVLLSDLGFFMSSENHPGPAPHEYDLTKPPKEDDE